LSQAHPRFSGRIPHLYSLPVLKNAANVLPCTVMAQPPQELHATSDFAGMRLDSFLAAQLTDTSRARIQKLIQQEKILVNGAPARSSFRLEGNEQITILDELALPPLRAVAEEIPLDIVYEDDGLAVINKPAGMMVHAGAGASEDARNRGTLVNALLHHFRELSNLSGDLRPGIVHRLDKETSGLIIVAKNDSIHRKLAAQFASRQVKKTYIALVHGWVNNDSGTIHTKISRDRVRRTRMSARESSGREAVTHYLIKERIDSPYGKFSLLDVRIETGRTHQIRVHLASERHPVVGDALYGAPREIRGKSRPTISLPRNFLHAARLEFCHPGTQQIISLESTLPEELHQFLHLING
jgi:23S rRNA pseudouridine1911/1915/1917 synthase